MKKKRKIVKFHQDRLGDWVATLSCGHTRHFRHNPPWQNRPWTQSERGRQQYIGQEISCPKCEASLTEETMSSKINEESLRVAEAVRAMCLKSALEAYEFGKMSGMCQEGAWELAVDAIRSLDLQKVLATLPGGQE